MSELNMLEVYLAENVSEKVVIETLTRIGICNKKDKILYPSVYLYKEDDRYYLLHFKSLLHFFGGYDNLSNTDIRRRDSIAFCLRNWGLIDFDFEKNGPYDEKVFVLPYKEKKDWSIIHKVKMKYEQI